MPDPTATKAITATKLLLGQNARRVRRVRHLTQGDVASRMGCDPAGVVRLEKGRANPTIATLAKLCTSLDVGIETLLEGAPRAGQVSAARTSRGR